MPQNFLFSCNKKWGLQGKRVNSFTKSQKRKCWFYAYTKTLTFIPGTGAVGYKKAKKSAKNKALKDIFT